MPYFFILPFLGFAVLMLSLATLVCAVVPPLRGALPFAWRILVWSGAGCVLANVAVLALYLVPVALHRSGMTPPLGSAGSAVGVVLRAALLLGPFIASGAGFLGGAAFGIWRASKSVSPRA